MGSTQPNRWEQEVAIALMERLALPFEEARESAINLLIHVADAVDQVVV